MSRHAHCEWINKLGGAMDNQTERSNHPKVLSLSWPIFMNNHLRQMSFFLLGKRECNKESGHLVSCSWTGACNWKLSTLLAIQKPLPDTWILSCYAAFVQMIIEVPEKKKWTKHLEKNWRYDKHLESSPLDLGGIMYLYVSVNQKQWRNVTLSQSWITTKSSLYQFLYLTSSKQISC